MRTIDQTHILEAKDSSKAAGAVATAPVSGMTESRSGRGVPLGQPSVRYIKLGKGGGWAQDAFERGIIPFACYNADHAACMAGDWPAVKQQLIASGIGGTAEAIRELRDFYKLPQGSLWFTIADGHLRWAVAGGPVEVAAGPEDGQPPRWRKTVDGWHAKSLTGEALTAASLSSALTKVSSYQRTICSTAQADYLLRRIRGEVDPLAARARVLKREIAAVTLDMIRRLQPDEFETLVDLIFTRSGWRRVSRLGGNQPDVDLLLEQPLTGRTGWVQVKSSCTQAVLDEYYGRFLRSGAAGDFFFVVHTTPGALRLPDEPNLHLWSGDRLADIVSEAGLFNWLLKRIR
ncbi:MAG: restriction endonuclease [Afipia sp.]|jgi:hypothetical protein